jgi:pSer/pThr/pTyr-binding forkhead associated (FHA) protein
MDGILYCENCGSDLVEAESMPSVETEEVIIPVDGPSVKLIVSTTGDEIYLPEKEEIVIGREDPVSAIFPDIDTTPYGGEEDGVSRQHAKIFHRDDQFYVEDLDTVNCTFLNKTKIEPESPLPLTNGDELMLGRLKFNVVFA